MLVLCFLLQAFQGFAEEPKVVSFGHNLTSTTHTLKKNHFAVGTPVVAYGLTDDVSIGTSSWLLYDYNMSNLYVRYRFSKTEKRSQALQLGYFDTFQEQTQRYDMKAFWLMYAKGWHYEKYNFFLNGQVMYFFEDRIPFSLRRPMLNDDPTELVVSSLHEVELRNGFFLMGEMGLLGISRRYMYLHTGASLQWRSQSWLIQFGFSNTGTFQAYFTPDYRSDKRFLYYRTELSQDVRAKNLKYDFSMHPEIVLQYYF